MLSISFSFSNNLLFSFSSTIKSLEGIASNTNLFVFVSLFSSTFAMIIPFSFLGNSFLTSISETFLPSKLFSIKEDITSLSESFKSLISFVVFITKDSGLVSLTLSFILSIS